MKIARVVTAAVLAATVAACGGVASPSTYTPDDFSGTLQPASEANRGFEVRGTGELQLELTSLNPLPRVGFVAMAVGRYTGGFCSPLPGWIVTQAGLNRSYALGRITRGSYCITISDANLALSGPTAFNIRILHP